jgi:predicted Zn-dependent protease
MSYRLQAEHLGRSYAEHVEATSKLITDPTIAEYVNRIAQTLVRNSETQVQVTLKIIDAEEVSAFSLPGGSVFIHSGLILAADNEAELAGVIAHEIAHLAACHAAQEIAREELTDAASTPLIFRIVFRRAIRNTIFLKPTRSFEAEADSLGVTYLYNAGYDPQALPAFFAKIKAREKQGPRNSANVLDIHPPIADRIKRTQQATDALLSHGSEYKLDTSEFQEIKKRLVGLQNPQVDKNDGKENPAFQDASTKFRP